MSWVYFIQHGAAGAIKIGTTAGNPHARLRALQTGAPEPLRLVAVIPGDASLEHELHEKFKAHRLRRDGEWFAASPELVCFVNGIQWATDKGPKPEDDGGWEISPKDYARAAAALETIDSAITASHGDQSNGHPPWVDHLLDQAETAASIIGAVAGVAAAAEEILSEDYPVTVEQVLEALEAILEARRARVMAMEPKKGEVSR